MPTQIRREPVCNMEVHRGEAVGSSQFGEWVHVFCCQRCKEEFDRDPIRYLLKK